MIAHQSRGAGRGGYQPRNRSAFSIILAGFLLANICVLAGTLAAQARAAHFVVDQARVLKPDESLRLLSKLAAFNRETSTQIVVVILNDLKGRPIEEVSLEMAEGWGIGQKGKDNGILILAALDDRRVRIEVGYGLEGAVPDAIAKRIIDGSIVPHFRNERYFAGLDAATDALIGLTRGEYTADDIRPVSTMSDDDMLFGRIFVYAFGGFLVVIAFGIGFTTKGTRRWVGLALGCGLVLWAWYTELDYWPHYQNAWFWARMIFAPLASFAAFLFYFIHTSTNDVRHAVLLKRVRNDKTWDRLLRRYDAPAVLRVRDELAAEVEAAEGGGGRRLATLEAKLAEYLKQPDRFFRRRNDADLIDLAADFKKSGILECIAFLAGAREEIAELLRRERDYFKARKLDDLNETDRERLTASLRRLREVQKDPCATLAIDGPGLRAALGEFMNPDTDGSGAWKKWSKKYTGASIKRTREAFAERYAAATRIQGDAGERALAEFYLNNIEKLTQRPQVFLTSIAVAKATARARSRSSGSSSSSSSYASSSFSSGSSSSFGGGSFGGGGASGSW